MNEFEAHESSYDHQHKKRLRDMKAMQRDPNASDKARRAERKADEKSGLITIKPLKLDGAGSKGGFKKGGFKSAFGPPPDAPVPAKESSAFKKVHGSGHVEKPAEKPAEPTIEVGSDDDDDGNVGYDYYDPRKPTCGGSCGRGVAVMTEPI
jgi:hypothetical protein